MLGAPSDDDACPADINCNSGSAYVFNRRGQAWVEIAKLTASDAAAGDRFGAELANTGNTVIVGAAGNAATSTGAVYVFR